MKVKKVTNKQLHRLFIRTPVKSENALRPKYDQHGREIIYTEWVEVGEINLGSSAKPNKDVIEVKFVPIEYEKDDDSKKNLKKGIRDILDRFDDED